VHGESKYVLQLVHGKLNSGKFSLFMADLIQAGGMAMDAKWVNDGKVQTGTYCTAQGTICLFSGLVRVCQFILQGVLHQLGETGVAMSTLVRRDILQSLCIVLT
jgi:hypothetical protein